LRTHRGVIEGGGNHRSSIFRSHVGAAIIRRDSRIGEFPDWGDQSAGTAENKSLETELEKTVSATISRMQVLCLDIRDSAGSRSDRAYIERNAIALLSKVGSRIDTPSDTWLGRSSAHPCIRKSGLWNVNFVDEPTWDPAFLEVLDYYARATGGKAPFSPDGNQVAFEWNGERQDNTDIYVKLIDSATPLRLTTDPAVDFHPAWSPDGRSIGFERLLSDDAVAVILIPAIGGPEREVGRIAAGSSKIAWSPDGKWLVVADKSSAEQAFALFLLSPNTGEMRSLIFSPAKRERSKASVGLTGMACSTAPEICGVLGIERMSIERRS
jgi:hypothetical protein